MEGLIDRIEVRLNMETNEHELDIIFKMGLVGDGIEYINPDKKKDGYELVEGATNAPLVLPNVELRGRKKRGKLTGMV